MISTLKEVREALRLASRTSYSETNQDVFEAAITKLDALIAQEKAEPVLANPATTPDAILVYLEQAEATLDYVTREGQNSSTVAEALRQLKKAIDLRTIEVAKVGFKHALAPQPAPSTSPLTDFDIAAAIEVADAKWADADVPLEWVMHFARAIEAKIGAKP